MALNAIASEQSNATSNTSDSVTRLLNYAATHLDSVLKFSARNMVLHIHSYASYLCKSNSKSRSGGHYFLSNRTIDPNKPPPRQPTNNYAIHSECCIQCNVLTSNAKAEVGCLFINGKKSVPLRATLTKMGHPQPPTPIQTYNSTANGIVNSSIFQVQSKTVDMRFYWVRYKVNQNQSLVYWFPGS